VTLFHLFKELGEELDEEKIVKSATGIRDTTVWKKLFKFQRHGVVGALDKLERYGGCIIADSVGLGKTFEALAIIKYYEPWLMSSGAIMTSWSSTSRTTSATKTRTKGTKPDTPG